MLQQFKLKKYLSYHAKFFRPPKFTCVGPGWYWVGHRPGRSNRIFTCKIWHRSHFGSRYKLGCCGHAGLFHARFDDRHCRQKVFQKDCFKIRAVWSEAPASGKSCSTCVGLNPTSVLLRLHTYYYMAGIKPSRIIQRNWSLADPSSSGLLWHFGD